MTSNNLEEKIESLSSAVKKLQIIAITTSLIAIASVVLAITYVPSELQVESLHASEIHLDEGTSQTLINARGMSVVDGAYNAQLRDRSLTISAAHEYDVELSTRHLNFTPPPASSSDLGTASLSGTGLNILRGDTRTRVSSKISIEQADGALTMSPGLLRVRHSSEETSSHVSLGHMDGLRISRKADDITTTAHLDFYELSLGEEGDETMGRATTLNLDGIRAGNERGDEASLHAERGLTLNFGNSVTTISSMKAERDGGPLNPPAE